MISTQPNLKENVMNEAPQVELIDLGDAIEETKGDLDGKFTEVSPVSPYRLI